MRHPCKSERITTVLFLLSIISISTFSQILKIKGSDTVLPLSQKEAETYMKKNILLFIFGLIFLISSQYTAASCGCGRKAANRTGLL